MMHIVKWKSQTGGTFIEGVSEHPQLAREEIADIQEETPSLTEAVIRKMWDYRRKTRGRRQDESENADPRIILG